MSEILRQRIRTILSEGTTKFLKTANQALNRVIKRHPQSPANHPFGKIKVYQSATKKGCTLTWHAHWHVTETINYMTEIEDEIRASFTIPIEILWAIDPQPAVLGLGYGYSGIGYARLKVSVKNKSDLGSDLLQKISPAVREQKKVLDVSLIDSSFKAIFFKRITSIRLSNGWWDEQEIDEESFRFTCQEGNGPGAAPTRSKTPAISMMIDPLLNYDSENKDPTRRTTSWGGREIRGIDELAKWINGLMSNLLKTDIGEFFDIEFNQQRVPGRIDGTVKPYLVVKMSRKNIQEWNQSHPDEQIPIEYR